jgi:O-antigen/teichoic acid export membrane protein/peptidoglycan/xylan/chitin deacetylase (PgdA/CDA1 family)
VTRRVSWTLADQALSSITNFAVGIAIARTTSSASLGIFAVAFSIYVVAGGLSRTITTDPLMIRDSASDRRSLGDSISAATGLSLLNGFVASCVVLGIASVTQGEPRACFVALAIALPGLLLQDAWRFVFFTEARPRTAAANDAVWAIVLLFTFSWVFTVGSESAATLVAAWGAAGTAAAAVGVYQARRWPRPAAAKWWLREHRDINFRFAIEFTVSTAALQLVVVMLAAFAGLAATGALQGALLLLGPLNVVMLVANPVGIPELVRVRERQGLRGVFVGAVVISALALFATCAWVMLVFAAPVRLGTALLGDTWKPSLAVLPGVALFTAATAIGLGAQTGLRSLAAAKRVLRVRIYGTLALFVLTIPLAVQSGALGVSWALAASQSFTACLWWIEFRNQLKGGATASKARPSLQASSDAAEAPSRVPESTVTISVDDGHPSDLRAADLIAKLGYAATFYVPARNEEQVVMDAVGVRQLSEGFEVGSHTFNHLPLTHLPHDLARREIVEGKMWLEDTLSSPVTSFCYPQGKFSSRIASLVAEAGFDGARTTMNARLAPPNDPFRWGVSTQALTHSRSIQVRHAVLEGNWLGLTNYARIFRFSFQWSDYFERAVSHVCSHGGIAHLWFHSWRLDHDDGWDELERVLRRLKSQYAFRCATNGELFALCTSQIRSKDSSNSEANGE